MRVCVPAGLTIPVELVQNLLVVRDRDPAQTRSSRHEDFLSHETGMSGINQGIHGELLRCLAFGGVERVMLRHNHPE